LLTSELVVDSLCELQHFRLFHHIEEVSSPGDWVIDIHLNKPDLRLPVLLAETCARIVTPNVQQDNEFDIMPIGTGPFKVVINDDKRLILEAFDSYFGYRPLLDQIEVCVIDEADSSLVFPTLNTPLRLRRGASREDVDLDPGCIYLQLNRRDGIACDRVWAEYLSSKLSGLNLFSLLPEETVVTWGMLPAHGLKPGWYHHRPCRQIILPEITRPVRIAYHAKHPMYPHLVDVIQTLLTQDGIQVELSTYEHGVVDVTQKIDIWIKAMGISNHRDDALAGWLLDYSDVSQTSQPEDFAGWQQLIDCWRSEPDQPFPAREIGKSVIEKYQIVPLFHSWFGISHDQCGALQNAKCNALGWFDFGRVWVKPKLD
jgi:SgrR family transcriptional regulator